MPPRAELLVVAGDPLWPPHHGGRIRAGRIVDELRRRLTVCVAAPLDGPPPPGIAVEELPPARPVTPLQAVTTLRPRLGRALLGPERAAVLARALARDRPRAVLFTSCYVAATAPPVAVPTAVDFQDVEVRRMVSMARSGTARARLANGLEAVKARWWEPPLARGAAVVTSPSTEDVRLLSRWGATALHVPNGADRFAPSPSPARGPVTFIASCTYAPNRLALDWLLTEVWPRLRRAEPDLRLRVVGRRAHEAVRTHHLDGPVDVLSDVEKVDEHYQQASVIVAPVRMGGGCQLKVTEALARGRAVVATPFSARSVPPEMTGAVLVADDAPAFATAVLTVWRDVEARRRHEKTLAEARPLPTWHEACAPLVDAIEALVRRQRR